MACRHPWPKGIGLVFFFFPLRDGGAGIWRGPGEAGGSPAPSPPERTPAAAAEGKGGARRPPRPGTGRGGRAGGTGPASGPGRAAAGAASRTRRSGKEAAGGRARSSPPAPASLSPPHLTRRRHGEAARRRGRLRGLGSRDGRVSGGRRGCEGGCGGGLTFSSPGRAVEAKLPPGPRAGGGGGGTALVAGGGAEGHGFASGAGLPADSRDRALGSRPLSAGSPFPLSARGWGVSLRSPGETGSAPCRRESACLESPGEFIFSSG